MKKYCLFILIMFSWFYSFSKNSMEADTLIQEINSYRNKMNIASMQKDSSLISALEQLAQKKVDETILTNKDSVRTVLKSFFIYDYQISLLALDYRESYDLDMLFEKNAGLKKVIQNPDFNKINYLLIQQDDKNILLLIAVQNYIDFNETLFFEGSFLDDGGLQGYITLGGKSRSNPLKFSLNDDQLTVYNDTALRLNTVEVKENGNFSVKLDLTGMKREKLNHVAFFDNTGKIIANVKIQLAYD
jgi:hypothetical protein